MAIMHGVDGVFCRVEPGSAFFHPQKSAAFANLVIAARLLLLV